MSRAVKEMIVNIQNGAASWYRESKHGKRKLDRERATRWAREDYDFARVLMGVEEEDQYYA